MELDNKFVKGLFCKIPNKAAPDFVLLDMSFKPHDFFKWAQQFITEENKGWVNIQILRSKDGSKIYGKLNNYKRAVSTEEVQATKDYNDTKYSDQDRQNVKEAADIGLTLTDEELDSLAESIPF